MNSFDTEILLMEDDPSDVDIALHALRSNGVTNAIYVARDGQEAMDLLFRRGKYRCRARSTRPEVVLLSATLLEANGGTLLQAIRTHSPTPAIPVVLMLSFSKHGKSLIQTSDAGVQGYIHKPIDFDQFKEAVKHLGFSWVMIHNGSGHIVDQAAHFQFTSESQP
jgi:two-component system, response regulator